jgi:hypothetical protein
MFSTENQMFSGLRTAGQSAAVEPPGLPQQQYGNPFAGTLRTRRNFCLRLLQL